MLKEALSNRSFVFTCEFVPGRGFEGPAVEAATRFAKEIADAGVTVHAISLTDNPGGGPAISPDVIAADILKVGGEPLVHFTARDLNRNAMESRASALAHIGVKNLLVLSGDYPVDSAYGGPAGGVYDLDSVQAIRLISAMNQGLVVPGRKPGTTVTLPPTNFCIGAAVSPFKLTEEELMFQYFKMEKKIRAGAHFIITQLGYDMRKFLEVRRYLASRGLDTPVIGNAYVLSAGVGRVMNSGGVPGCVVTDELLRVLKAEAKDPDKGKAKRLERAAKMIAAFKGMGFAGVHIGGFGLKTADYVHVIERGLELAPRWEEFIPELCFGQPDEFYAFPPPEKFRVGENEEDPVRHLSKGRKPLSHAILGKVHDVVFKRDSLGHKVMSGYYRVLDKHPRLAAVSHAGEFGIKRLMFGCRDCGDCMLFDTANRCPMCHCAKQSRNGPCGGSVGGMCEKDPTEKACAWTEIYRRLKSEGKLDVLREGYIPPCRRDLANTSGWANYFLYRDHAALADADGQTGKTGPGPGAVASAETKTS
ncbi:MAG: methylenetetrahydrofolate reductase [Kiritimatiellaeota bacterium]|nr:methylenetetrahydrofolate reductase [Kiritimatiellota bacterium]